MFEEGVAMADSANLWAVAFDGIERADKVRAEIAKLVDQKSQFFSI
jgi:hypothetical protein